MAPFGTETLTARLDRVRANARAASLDALVVTHLPNIQYLTRFAGTAGIVVILPSACALVVDFRYMSAAQALIEQLDAGTIRLEVVDRSYDETLVGLLRREKCQRIGIEAAWLSVGRFNTISSMLTAAGETGSPPVLIPTERLVERVRVIKDTAEIATIREAARRLTAIARRLGSFATPGRTELEVAADIDAAIREAGFSRPAFDTIVASGPNSALPHARPTARLLEPGDPTVLDFGGVYDGYCVDLTRTVQLGPVSEALGGLYAAVAEAQQAAIAAVRPGVLASQIDAAARTVLQNRGLGEAFGHGTGHGLGLEVHEEPRIGRPIPGVVDERVQPGMVFTVEPGAYVAGLGGVRIEDDVLVTTDGCEVLTG